MDDPQLPSLALLDLVARFKDKLEHNACDRPPDDEADYFPSAVMILFVWANDTWNILYTQRTDVVRDHKGQVSFPGGAWEDTDSCLRDTALRETLEEIGVQAEDIQIFGSMPPELTVTGYYIVPYVGILGSWPYEFKLQTQEVESAFIIPVTWLIQESMREEREFFIPDRNISRRAIFYAERDGHTLWGITAMLTIKLLELLK